MLVPVQGGVANLQKRVRTIQQQEAALATVPIPSVYIFNVGPREWRNRFAAGRAYTIPACPKDAPYSPPLVVSTLCLSEIDLADGGNNMGVIMNPGLSGIMNVNGEPQKVVGVANDIIGTDSTAAALELNTTNLEWFGVFVSQNKIPTEDELLVARDKKRQMDQLIYATGAEKVHAGEKVAMIDRPRYNEAAAALGVKPLWGNLDHTRASCPECHEDIIEGAHYCKHCQQAIDPASVAARAKKRQREADKLMKDEEAIA